MKKTSLKIIVALITLSVIGLIVVQFYLIKKAISLEEEMFNKNVGLALKDIADNLEEKSTADVLIQKIVTDSLNNIVTITEEGKDTDDYNDNYFIKKIENNDSLNQDVDIQVITKSSRNGKIKLEGNISVKNDTILKNKIVWQIQSDSLIKRKTKIIENVFEDLLEDDDVNIWVDVNSESVNNIIRTTLNKYGVDETYDFAISTSNVDSLLMIKSNLSKDVLLQSKYKVNLLPNNVFKNSNILYLYFPERKAKSFKNMWGMFLLSFVFTSLIVFLFYKTIKMFIEQKKLTELKNELLNNITHEFKTPISTISLAAEILQQDKVENKGKYVNVIHQENKRLSKMVDDILDASRLENFKFELKMSNCDINDLINSAIENYKLHIEEKGGSLILNLSKNPIRLRCDCKQLQIAMGNILDNAVKYNNDKPVIKISTLIEGDKSIISIEDNGIGIDKQYQNKIFETFFRVPTGNIHDVKGNGIGLSFVKKVIEVHGGEIKLSSTISKGSKFTIKLPVANAEV